MYEKSDLKKILKTYSPSLFFSVMTVTSYDKGLKSLTEYLN